MRTKSASRKASKAPKAPAVAIRLNSRALFDRVAAILDKARGNVVRAINTQMVLAYWLIGREIVQEVQKGEERAEYGKQIVSDLSRQLTERYGKGFSVSNLKYFRQFYQLYAKRIAVIGHTTGGELTQADAALSIGHKACGESESVAQAAPQAALQTLTRLQGALQNFNGKGFSARLSWSHYRALLGVENQAERQFYEIEAERDGWSVPHLERQIHTFLFARLLKSRDKAGVLSLARKGMQISHPMDAIKNPYVLDFLNLPESEALHESELEAAIIGNLQAFLLELGKGFAFVSRQKRIDFDGDFFYIDLVFYHCILKCYLLIDLKIGKLTHQDVGQMDSYVRMYDELFSSPGDNPTIGLILCSDKSGAIAKYSVLKGSRQLFASRYTLHLPTEAELTRELERERRLIENSHSITTVKKRRKS